MKMARLQFLLDYSDDLEDDLDMLAKIKFKKKSRSRFIYRSSKYNNQSEIRKATVEKSSFQMRSMEQISWSIFEYEGNFFQPCMIR